LTSFLARPCTALLFLGGAGASAKNCQLVVMSLKPGEDIGAEVYKLDQSFRVEQGEGKAVLDCVEHRIKAGFAVLVAAGTRHNIINGPSGQ
jgi:mannose-6-phosphate isomerase-like protein (cupin superfamily)